MLLTAMEKKNRRKKERTNGGPSQKPPRNQRHELNETDIIKRAEDEVRLTAEQR